MTLEELVKALLKEGIYGDDFGWDEETDSLYYVIQGFAKSGNGTLLYGKDGKIHLETRYQQDDIVESVKDVVAVAYGWDSGYCSKSHDLYGVYYVGSAWKKLYEKYGYDISDLKC